WGVFSNCFIFNDLEIPSSVEYINEKAFRYIALVESKFINHSEFKNFTAPYLMSKKEYEENWKERN
ncbi:MAG: hypothetical protein ACRC4M_04530, partial [Mycoplasma sp.]